MALTLAQQELADELTVIIGQINTGRETQQIQKLVELKVEQLTAHEPFYLMGILQNATLTPFEKAGAFTSLRHTATGEERYPASYHEALRAITPQS